jgi:hypothetical protein
MIDTLNGLLTSPDGTKEWWKNGAIHRAGRDPAMIFTNGSKFWCIDGEIHRTDGPAAEFSNGKVAWYLNGDNLSFDEWLDKNTALTDEEKVMMKLKYG